MIQSVAALILNLLIVCWTAFCVNRSAWDRREGERPRRSAYTFRYFTTDSNVLAALSALCILPFHAAALVGGASQPPAWALLFKYTGAVSVCVTLLTVLLFLGPTQGYRDLLSGDGLYMHLIGPLAALFSFCALEKGARLSWQHGLIALAPVAAYACVYLVMVVYADKENGGWEDFYGFNPNGKWPISIVSMLIGSYAVSMGVAWLHNFA